MIARLLVAARNIPSSLYCFSVRQLERLFERSCEEAENGENSGCNSLMFLVQSISPYVSGGTSRVYEKGN